MNVLKPNNGLVQLCASHMNRYCRSISSIILGATLIALGLNHGFAEEPKVKVLNIEAAMRAWQARFLQVRPFDAYWNPRSDGREPGLYPEDCFYGKDLLVPQKAFELVENLYYEMEWNLHYFVKTPSDGNLDGYVGRGNDEGPNTWKHYQSLGNYVPAPTLANHTTVFAQLVEIISRLNAAYIDVDSATGATRRQWTLGVGDSITACATAKETIASNWTNNGTNSTSNDIIWKQEQLNKNSSGVFSGSLTATKGSYQVDLSRFNGNARFLSSIWTYTHLDPFTHSMGPLAFDENANTGSVWTSGSYGWGAGDDVTLTLDCPDTVQTTSLTKYRVGIVVIRPQFTHNIKADQVWVECEACGGCKDRCEPGAPTYANKSMDVTLPLGGGVDGSAGFLQLKAEIPAADLGTAWALKTSLKKGSELLFDFGALSASGAPRPRQVLAPQCLVDVHTIDAYSYELRFYQPTQIGTKNSSGFYTLSGTPFRTIKVENPDRSPTVFNRVKISTLQGSLDDIATYTYSSATSGWTLAHQVGQLTQTDSRSSTFDSGTNRRTEIHQIVDDAARVVLKERNVYQVFPWNVSNPANSEELIETTSDPDGAALTTTYEYYTVSGAAGYGRIKQQISPSGFWQKFEYDSSGQLIKTTTPFGDTAPGSIENVRVREITRSSFAPHETEVEALVFTGGTRVELARTYRILNINHTSTIVCQTAGASVNAADNLVTTTTYLDDGEFWGRISWEQRPDGTRAFYSYVTNLNGSVTTTVSSGKVNALGDAITDGTRIISTVNKAGELIEESVYDIASNLLVRYKLATLFDSAGRVARIDYPDGTFEQRSYACCGLDYVIDRQGLRTDYVYDEFRRLKRETTAGIALNYTYDGSGRRLTTTRTGTDSSNITLETNAYDTAGRLSSTITGGRTTSFAETVNGLGQKVKTTTYPNTGTRIETFMRDGSLLGVAGTAAAPKQYQYGADADGSFVKEISVGSSGEQTEWTKTYSDLVGRQSKTVFADGAFSRNYFNSVGQLVKAVDPDGVTTLIGYDARGVQDTVAIDMNGNGIIDFVGTDRLVRTTRNVSTKTVDSINYSVQRETTQIWETNNDAPVTVTITEQTGDGFRSWQTVRGLITSTVTTTNGAGLRTTTTTGPDGVKTVQTFNNGRLASLNVKTAADVQISGVTYSYDPHGRLGTVTDTRNGATTYTYYSDDQVLNVTTPDPDTTRSGPGYDPQTTTYTYNSAGRLETVTQPDAAVVTTTYYPTGAVKRTSGARVYPVEYTYDSQGRVKTLTTWQNFAGDSGRAVTTWNYDPTRGFLVNKRYADNTGPSYTYKPSGRLLTRTWARTPVITTTYVYNAAGELQTTDYSDTTPDVTIVYDRAGRPNTVTDGAGARTLSYHASGQLEDETYTSGLLNGFVVDRTFDSLARFSGISTPSVSTAAYTYDAASRLDTVTSGANTATYTYVANSPLVQTVTFKNGGTTRLTKAKVYDKLNRLTSITNTPSGASSALSYAYTYNSANQRTRVTREDNAYWNYGYDSLGQATSSKKYLATDTGVSGHDYAWTFDDIGNRKTATTNGAAATYTPNALNQYSQRSVPGLIDVLGAADAATTVTVTVDSGTPQATTRQGEIFYKQLSVTNTSGAQNPQLKITGVKNLAGPTGEDVISEITKPAFVPQTPEAFVYDLDGNLVDDARWYYTWDGENRLIAIETSTTAVTAGVTRRKLEFTYDGQSRRIAKKVSNWSGSGWTLVSHTLFSYDGWNLLAELNALSSNTAFRTYLWGADLSGFSQGAGGVGGLLSATDVLANMAHFACYDGNGNVAGLVTASGGSLSGKYDYTAFGQSVLIDGALGLINPFRFSTKYTDFETGYLYYGYRCYASDTGRWLNRDPVEERGGLNLQALVSNDPVNVVDYLGLEELLMWDTFEVRKLSAGDAIRIGLVFKSLYENLKDLGPLEAAEVYNSVSEIKKSFATIVNANKIDRWPLVSLSKTSFYGNVPCVEKLGFVVRKAEMPVVETGREGSSLGEGRFVSPLPTFMRVTIRTRDYFIYRCTGRKTFSRDELQNMSARELERLAIGQASSGSVKRVEERTP